MSSGGDCTHCRVCPIYIKDRLGIFISKASSPWALPRQFMLYSDYFASIYDMTFAQRKLPVPSPLGLKVRALQQLHASQLLRHGKCYNITVSWAMQELFSEISADLSRSGEGLPRRAERALSSRLWQYADRRRHHFDPRSFR